MRGYCKVEITALGNREYSMSKVKQVIEASLSNFQHQLN